MVELQLSSETLPPHVYSELTKNRSTVHDDFQGTGFWPQLYDGRAMTLDSWNDHVAGLSIKENVEKYNAAMKSGDNSRRNVWA